MKQRIPNLVRRLGPGLCLAVLSAALWAAWLVHPDGSTTGPYEAWQVIGLVLTLLAPVCWAASRRHATEAVVGTTVGLTTAAYYDWSDDASGLFAIGVALVMLGTLGATAAVSAVTSALTRRGGTATAR
jgi:hypothetical protein